MVIFDDIELLQRLALALGIGLLFGIERGWKTREQHGGRRTAGLRTFVLIGFLGGISGLLSNLLGGYVLGFVFLGLAGLVAAGYVQSQRGAAAPDHGMTTEVAALLAFLLSALVVLGDMLPPVAVAVVAVTFLHGKKLLHGWVAGLDRLELAAALQLLLISLVLLPVLPDRGFGPGGVINPFQIWLMVVLISALSFFGYFACKLAGARYGLIIVGLLGGMASSTAVTLSFSRLARRSPALATTLCGGIAMASTVMFARILVLVWVFRPTLVGDLAVPVVVMALISLASAIVLSLRRSASTERHGIELTDPSELATALGFGALLALVLLASYLVNQWLGHQAVYGVAVVSGLVDVDALTLSMAGLAGSEGFVQQVAANAIVLAAISNSIAKFAIVATVAGGAAARTSAIFFGLLVAGGLAALIFA
jgi:uncharacterized membrane protein (DUF4010 family)